MRISDAEFRMFAAMALMGIVQAKGTGHPSSCAKAAISVAEAMRAELKAIKGEDDDYGKSRFGSEGSST